MDTIQCLLITGNGRVKTPTIQTRFDFSRCRRRIDANRSHHPAVFVFQKVAVVDKGANDVGVAKIHANFNAGILLTLSVPVGDVDCVPQNRLVKRYRIPLQRRK